MEKKKNYYTTFFITGESYHNSFFITELIYQKGMFHPIPIYITKIAMSITEVTSKKLQPPSKLNDLKLEKYSSNGRFYNIVSKSPHLSAVIKNETIR